MNAAGPPGPERPARHPWTPVIRSAGVRTRTRTRSWVERQSVQRSRSFNALARHRGSRAHSGPLVGSRTRHGGPRRTHGTGTRHANSRRTQLGDADARRPVARVRGKFAKVFIDSITNCTVTQSSRSAPPRAPNRRMDPHTQDSTAHVCHTFPRFVHSAERLARSLLPPPDRARAHTHAH
jgi:hypothetical protein